MTEEQKTELVYLQDLVFESARWRISEDDDLSPIEREVRDRLDKLQAAMNGEEPAEGPVPDTGCAVLPAFPPWGSQIPETTAGDRKIKMNYNGRIVRLPAYMLEQVPCRASHTGYSWAVKEEYRAEADAKVEQLDSMARTRHGNAAGGV
jgi:hypothetical protein